MKHRYTGWADWSKAPLALLPMVRWLAGAHGEMTWREVLGVLQDPDEGWGDAWTGDDMVYAVGKMADDGRWGSRALVRCGKVVSGKGAFFTYATDDFDLETTAIFAHYLLARGGVGGEVVLRESSLPEDDGVESLQIDRLWPATYMAVATDRVCLISSGGGVVDGMRKRVTELTRELDYYQEDGSGLGIDARVEAAVGCYSLV